MPAEWWAWWAENSQATRDLALTLAAIFGLPLLFWRTRSLHRQAVASLKQAETATRQAEIAADRHAAQVEADRERRLTESFTRAVEQLGSEKLEARLGAIYALERIARESKIDHWPIMGTLTAYIRERSPWTSEKAEEAAREEDKSPDERERPRPSVDVQAALTVIGRRRREYDAEGQELNLAGADLRGADLSHGHFEGADFYRTHLEYANLFRTHLEGARMWGARFGGAVIMETHFEGTDLWGTDVEDETLAGAYTDEKTFSLKKSLFAGALGKGTIVFAPSGGQDTEPGPGSAAASATR